MCRVEEKKEEGRKRQIQNSIMTPISDGKSIFNMMQSDNVPISFYKPVIAVLQSNIFEKKPNT